MNVKNTFIDLAKNLIKVPSEAGEPAKLHDVLEIAEHEINGFTIERFEKDGIPSLLAYSAKKRPAQFKVILNAHLDIVPGKVKQYSPFEKDGKLYGRGSDDMKAAAAVEILVFKELAKKLNYPLGLQLVTDEEVGGFNGTKFQINKGIKADFVIAGEPTDFGINNKAKGIMWFDIKFKGVSAHGAYPWQGENAIVKASKLIETILKKYPIPKKEAWQTTVNIAKITTANQTYNKVPDECTVSIDVRYIPEDKNTVIDQIKETFPENTQYKIRTNEPAQFTNEKNAFIKSLQSATIKVLGKESNIIVKHGGSDIRHFNQIGCDGVTFGPIGAGLHTDNEWVDIKSLEQYYKILKEFLLSLS